MLTSLTLPTSVVRLTAPPPPASSAAGSGDIRPAVEWWEVGDARYDSTADLLKGCTLGANGTPATYHWRQETSFGAPEKWSAARDGAVTGAFTGAMLGGMLGIGVNIVGFIGTVMTAGMLGVFGGVGLLAPIAIGAVGGAVIGALSGPKNAEAHFHTGTLVDGQLQPEPQPDGSTHLAFYVNGQVSEKVDLERYAQASPGQPPASGDQPWWVQGGHMGAIPVD